jgi:hypothetical protein
MDNQPVVATKPRRKWLKITLLILAGLALLIVVSVGAAVVKSGLRSSVGVSSSNLMMKGGLGISGGAPQFAAISAGESVSYDESAYAPAPPRDYQQTGGQTAAEVDQKIIKNGSLQMVVKSVSEGIDRIGALAGDKGGFVQNSSVTERGDGTHYGQISVRVPAKDFETAMNEIQALAALVKNESASGQDVTEQYTDLESQLRNAQAQEQTYLRVLEKANTVEDILKVQQRLGDIRGTIESLQGRLKYLENVTSYSTISVSLEEEPVVRLPTKEFRPGDAVKQAVQSLVSSAQKTLIAVIWIVIVGGGLLLPWALLALIIVLIVRGLRRKKK